MQQAAAAAAVAIQGPWLQGYSKVPQMVFASMLMMHAPDTPMLYKVMSGY